MSSRFGIRLLILVYRKDNVLASFALVHVDGAVIPVAGCVKLLLGGCYRGHSKTVSLDRSYI